MDPCPFVRILISNLALRLPVASKPAFSGIHPSQSPCYCKITFKNSTPQIVSIPLVPQDTHFPDPNIQSESTHFTLSHSDITKLNEKKVFSKTSPCIKIDIYTGGMSASCGFNSGKLLGSISVPLDLAGTELRTCVFQNGWVSVGENAKGSARAQVYVSVKAEPDPRFVFEFDGEPECSPQIFQVMGNIKQPVFTCNFTLRSCGDWNLGPRSSEASTSRPWLSSFNSDKDHPSKERKGWSITIHDLSGSPVAAASMVTPFVQSPGTDRVSRSNPGAWLILRPGDNTWKPWGRLEAWREHTSPNALGYRFEILPNSTTTTATTTLANSTLSITKGGKFTIDMTNMHKCSTPLSSPRNSTEFGSGSRSGSRHGSGSWLNCMNGGFVMSTAVEGVRRRRSRPQVEVGVQHVTCTEDAAVFVALAAAVDLSMDACMLFSQKLRKELRH